MTLKVTVYKTPYDMYNYKAVGRDCDGIVYIGYGDTKWGAKRNLKNQFRKQTEPSKPVEEYEVEI